MRKKFFKINAIITTIVVALTPLLVFAQSATTATTLADGGKTNKPAIAKPMTDSDAVHKKIENTLSLDAATCYMASLGGQKTDYVGFFNKCKPGTGLGVGKLNKTDKGTTFTLYFCIGYCGGLKRGVPITVPEDAINKITGEPSKENAPPMRPGAVNIINGEKKEAGKKEKSKEKEQAIKAPPVAPPPKQPIPESASQALPVVNNPPAKKTAPDVSTAPAPVVTPPTPPVKESAQETAKATKEERAARQAELVKQRAEATRERRAQEEEAKQARLEQLEADKQARQEQLEADKQARQEKLSSSKEAQKQLPQEKPQEKYRLRHIEYTRNNDELSPNINTLPVVVKEVKPTKPPQTPAQVQKEIEQGLAFVRHAIGGKLTLRGTVGYVYNFVQGNNFGSFGFVKAKFNGFAYGVSLDYTNDIGVGLSADYMNFKTNMTSVGPGDNSVYQYHYSADYNILTLTPNYRFKLDAAGHFGIRLGVGLGINAPNITWGKEPNITTGDVRATAGALYTGPRLMFNPKCTGLYGGSGVVGGGGYTDSKGAGSPSDPNGFYWPAGACDLGQAHITDQQVAEALERDVPTFGGAVRDGQISYYTGVVSHAVWKKILSTDANSKGAAALDKPFLGQPGAEAQFEWGKATWVPYSVWNVLSPSTQKNLLAAGAIPGPPPDLTIGVNKDIGFVVAPQVAFEYDAGMLHADINMRYMHELKKTKQHYEAGAAPETEAMNISDTSKSGPLAFFVGGAIGLNF
ncbi:MAG: MAP7 domain-containing protein [Hydrotalea sp.]|nr:MAP7 domain-containing protein [Hydrotalea sp.]